MAPDDLARLLDQELWTLQRLELCAELVREVPTIAAWQILNDLGLTRVSYDAFRTRRSLTINEEVSYRIMLRYRKHLSLARPEGRAPGQLAPGGPPFSLPGGGLPAPQWFVGRDDCLTALDAAFEQRSSGAPRW